MNSDTLFRISAGVFAVVLGIILLIKRKENLKFTKYHQQRLFGFSDSYYEFICWAVPIGFIIVGLLILSL